MNAAAPECRPSTEKISGFLEERHLSQRREGFMHRKQGDPPHAAERKS